MRARNLFAAVTLAAATTGCVGSNHWFKSDPDFQAYIDGLKLRTMTPEDAENALMHEGFTSVAGDAAIQCERSYDHGYGDQWQHVILTPDADDRSRRKVSTSLANTFV